MICAECGARVDWKRPGVARQITGWVQNRAAGGANHVLDQQPTGLWLCRMCADQLRTNARLRADQPGLFQ